MRPIPFPSEVDKMPEEAVVRLLVLVHEPGTTWHEESAFFIWEDKQMP